MKFAEWAKAYVALAGLVANGFLAESDLPRGWAWPIKVVGIVAAAFAVWKVPNRDPNEFDKAYFEGQ